MARSGATASPLPSKARATRTPVWSWSDDHSVGFWLRKITHDTIIHRIDAELTVGLRPTLSAQMASDGITDLLATITTLSTRWPFQTRSSRAARRLGRPCELQATDTADEWFVTRMPEGVRWTPDGARRMRSYEAAPLICCSRSTDAHRSMSSM